MRAKSTELMNQIISFVDQYYSAKHMSGVILQQAA